MAWKLVPMSNAAVALFAALVVWTAISVLIWRLRRRRLFLRKGHASTASQSPVSSKGN
jgi:cell division protein FtsL